MQKIKEEFPDNENFVDFHEVKTEKVENTDDIYYDQDPAGHDPLNTTGRNCKSMLERNNHYFIEKLLILGYFKVKKGKTICAA